MDTFSWIFTGIITLCLALYFVFTFAKKIELIQKISSSIIIPATGVIYIYFLLNYLPDSLHIIKLSAISFFCITIFWIIKSFFSGKKSLIIQRIFGVLSIIPIIFLYKSVFLIYRVPVFVNIIAACSYILIFFLFFIIFIKKAPFWLYIYGIITILAGAFINYCSLLTLCYAPGPFSIIRFIGSFGILAFLVFGCLNATIINLKLKKLISFSILLASIILLCLSNLMILY